jgi:hypothetical protein
MGQVGQLGLVGAGREIIAANPTCPTRPHPPYLPYLPYRGSRVGESATT